MKVSDYKKLRPLVKKTGVRLKVTDRYGLPFILKKYKKRIGFIFGVICFIAILAVLSNMVCTINVVGNETVPSEKIISVLEQLGIEKGYLPGSENYYFTEQKALTMLPELSWLAINRNGSVITVDVKERSVPPEIVDLKSPCDIVANKDGFIEKTEVFKGATIVKKGSAFVKGDVLVSGYVTDKQGNTANVHSIAKITALTENTLTCTIKKDDSILNLTGKQKTKRTLLLFGLRIPLYFSGNTFEHCEKYHSKTMFSIGGFSLPFGMEKDIYKEQAASPVTYTQEEMKASAYRKIENQIKFEYASAEILNIYYDEKITEDGFQLSALLKCRESVGVEAPCDPSFQHTPQQSENEE